MYKMIPQDALADFKRFSLKSGLLPPPGAFDAAPAGPDMNSPKNRNNATGEARVQSDELDSVVENIMEQPKQKVGTDDDQGFADYIKGLSAEELTQVISLLQQRLQQQGGQQDQPDQPPVDPAGLDEPPPFQGMPKVGQGPTPIKRDPSAMDARMATHRAAQRITEVAGSYSEHDRLIKSRAEQLQQLLKSKLAQDADVNKAMTIAAKSLTARARARSGNGIVEFHKRYPGASRIGHSW
jgi:hypothetical protein